MDRILVADGPIWTSAGITAGIDLALALIHADHGHEGVESGRLLSVIGTERIIVPAGERVFVARRVTHGFNAVNAGAQMTLVSTPPRHDRFFQAMSELPMPHAQADVQAVCKRSGQAIVGPVV